jgi:adenylosuccinate lyase
LKLSQIPEVIEVPNFSEEVKAYLEGLIDGYSMDDALEVTNIEEVANHDVKALNISLKRNARRFPRLKILSYLPEIACPRYWIFLRLPNDDSFAGVV